MSLLSTLTQFAPMGRVNKVLKCTLSASLKQLSKHSCATSFQPSTILLKNSHQDIPIIGPPSRINFLHTTGSNNGIDALDNVKQLPSAPKVALLLGVGGLVPLVASPYLMLSSGVFDPSLALYQNLYGATILSFVGGVRWGFTLPAGSSQSPDFSNLSYSVVPQLWACSALVAGHYMDCSVVGNVGVMLGLALSCYVDMTLPGYPAWYKGTRFCLTLVALLSLLTSVICAFILEAEKTEKE